MLLYIEGLSDVPDEALKAAFVTLARTWENPHALPMISDIRRTVAEETLGMPTPIEAWEQAIEFCWRERHMVACENEECDAGFVVRGEARGVYEAPIAQCPACKGAGGYEINKPVIHPLVERTIKAMGGWYGIKTSERIDATRREFLRVYASVRDDELRDGVLRDMRTRALEAA